ncbi:hypothetical protein Tco_1266253 [Tanacetum coccineum]
MGKGINRITTALIPYGLRKKYRLSLKNDMPPQMFDTLLTTKLHLDQDNTFNGMNGEDVTDHIARVLEITEWIKIPNVETNVLRLHVFSKSLSGDAEKWWNDEIEGVLSDSTVGIRAMRLLI